MTSNMEQRGCLACGHVRSEVWARARDIEYHSTADEFTYRRCSECESLYIDPVPADRLSVIYPTNYYSYAPPGNSPIHVVKRWLDRRFFKSLLRDLPFDDLNVLDVGGGAGWELKTLRESDSRVRRTRVVDLDPAAADLARSNGHDYVCGRIEDYSDADAFELVLLLNLIEHVEDPRTVLRKVAALLSSRGRILVKTPNHDSLDARLFRRRSWAGLHCPRHWVLFTRDSFASLVRECGLRVVHSSYTQGAPFWAASVLGALADVGIARVDRERPAVYHPAFGPLAALFAIVDFARRPFAKTSQMFFVLERAAP